MPLCYKIYTPSLVASIVVYLVTAFVEGGDSFFGHEANGRFFFAHDSGAPQHEVSRFVYRFNQWNMRVLLVLWGTGLVLGVRAEIAKRHADRSN